MTAPMRRQWTTASQVALMAASGCSLVSLEQDPICDHDWKLEVVNEGADTSALPGTQLGGVDLGGQWLVYAQAQGAPDAVGGVVLDSASAETGWSGVLGDCREIDVAVQAGRAVAVGAGCTDTAPGGGGLQMAWASADDMDDLKPTWQRLKLGEEEDTGTPPPAKPALALNPSPVLDVEPGLEVVLEGLIAYWDNEAEPRALHARYFQWLPGEDNGNEEARDLAKRPRVPSGCELRALNARSDRGSQPALEFIAGPRPGYIMAVLANEDGCEADCQQQVALVYLPASCTEPAELRVPDTLGAEQVQLAVGGTGEETQVALALRMDGRAFVAPLQVAPGGAGVPLEVTALIPLSTQRAVVGPAIDFIDRKGGGWFAAWLEPRGEKTVLRAQRVVVPNGEPRERWVTTPTLSLSHPAAQASDVLLSAQGPTRALLGFRAQPSSGEQLVIAEATCGGE